MGIRHELLFIMKRARGLGIWREFKSETESGDYRSEARGKMVRKGERERSCSMDGRRVCLWQVAFRDAAEAWNE